MEKKLFLSDFDGTLVTKDILDVVCSIKNKEQESQKINKDFIAGKEDGLLALKKRIDFLKGVRLESIISLLDKNPYLIKGARRLFKYLKDNSYITVLCSGNIMPILNYYKGLLGIDYIIGTKPRMNDDVILGIEMEDFKGRSFKVDGCLDIIQKYNIKKENIVAMGDSPADLGIFELAKIKIAVNPKGGIEGHASYVVDDNLTDVINYLSIN
jgi:phosphoserine phosphatase